MNRTKIEWVKNPDGTQGYTWNPITGCLNGCEYCYARKLANGRLKGLYMRNAHIPDGDGLDCNFDPFYPRFWEDRLNEPLHKVGKPLGIFPCDMSDLFGISIPEEWTRRVLSVIRACSSDRFYLLTKQPQNLIKFSPFPPNCWVGVTVTSNAAMTMAYYGLNQIKAGKKYISFEPLLGSIGLNDHIPMKQWVDWVIIGAQTKPYKPPDISWVEEIVEVCDKAGVPVFLKNNLMPLIIDQPKVPSWSSNRIGLRQEMPKFHPLNNP